MKIKRTIDGKEYEFELTDMELVGAYEEQEHKWDYSYCESMFQDFDDESFVSEYNVDKATAQQYIDEIAYEMRRQINKYDLDSDYARDAAFTEVLSRVAREMEAAE